ncbi:MAG TPA: metallophosphoesterase [Kofleriaceae bacterium]
MTPRAQWTEAPGRKLPAGPYSMLVGPGTVLVAWRDLKERSATVTWTSDDGKTGTATARYDGDLGSVVLKDVPAGPLIHYRVMMHGEEMAAGVLRAGTAPGQTKFRFAVFGDTRTNHQVHRAVIEALVKEDIDFYLHTGDMVERGGRDDLWTTFFQIERELMEKAPIVPAIGNHDLGNRGYYTKYFFLDKWSNGRSYFVTDWGNVRFVSLDVTIVCEKRCAQYEFVRQALEDGASQGKLMVLFMHNPPYSSGAHGSDLQLRAVLSKLCKTYGVELVVTGHDHDYERTKPIDGTTYVVSGSAGAPILAVNPHPFTAAARTEPHYVLIDVDGDKLSLRAINLRGEVFDSTVIPNNPPGGPVAVDPHAWTTEKAAAVAP